MHFIFNYFIGSKLNSNSMEATKFMNDIQPTQLEIPFMKSNFKNNYINEWGTANVTQTY